MKKTILYQSSPFTDVQGTPSYLSLEEAKYADKDSLNMRAYSKGAKIMAVLLEGKFTSAYDGRIESSGIQGFVKQSPPNKMIVVSDGNVARNDVIQGQPVPLGFDYSTQNTYGNEEFLMNAIDYLLDDSGLMSLRNRTVQLRMLDKQSIVMDKSYWQWLNLLTPLVFIWFIGAGLVFWRKKKFEAKKYLLYSELKKMESVEFKETDLKKLKEEIDSLEAGKKCSYEYEGKIYIVEKDEKMEHIIYVEVKNGCNYILSFIVIGFPICVCLVLLGVKKLGAFLGVAVTSLIVYLSKRLSNEISNKRNKKDLKKFTDALKSIGYRPYKWYNRDDGNF